MKKILALDTSSDNISLYIRKGKDEFLYNRKIRFGAWKLAGVIKKSLEKLSFQVEDLDTLIIGAGPGSFTGLRISYSIAKAFLLGVKLKAYQVGSFYTCAYPYRKRYEKIAVVSDARRGLIYLATFKSKNGILKKEKKEKLVRLDELVEERKDYFFVTYDQQLRDKILQSKRKIDFCPKDTYPNAKYLISAIGDLKIKQVRSADELRPLYLHPKTCQIRKP